MNAEVITVNSRTLPLNPGMETVENGSCISARMITGIKPGVNEKQPAGAAQ